MIDGKNVSLRQMPRIFLGRRVVRTSSGVIAECYLDHVFTGMDLETTTLQEEIDDRGVDEFFRRSVRGLVDSVCVHPAFCYMREYALFNGGVRFDESGTRFF